MHFLISAEQNRNVTTGGSWGQGEGNTTRHVITLLLYCEEHDKWAECQVWNTRPEHMQHVNKHSTSDCGTTCALPFSPVPPSCFLAVMSSSSLSRCCPSSISTRALPLCSSWKSIQLEPLQTHTIEKGGSKRGSVTHRCLFDTPRRSVFICTLCLQH